MKMHKQLRAIDLIFDEQFIYSSEKDAMIFNSEHKNGAPTVESIEEFKSKIVNIIREEGTFFENNSRLFE